MNNHIANETFVEDKQEILDKMLEMLRCTSNLGDDRYNSLVELKFIPKGTKIEGSLSRFVHDGVATEDIVRPIYEDGNGNNGYYDVVVSGDNGLGVICDVFKQYVVKR